MKVFSVKLVLNTAGEYNFRGLTGNNLGDHSMDFNPTAKGWQVWCWRGLLAIAIGAAYSNSLAVPFIYDDVRNIVDNPAVRHFCLGEDPLDECMNRRRVARWSFNLNYAWGEYDVKGYHVANVLIHLAATLLLFEIVRQTLLLGRWNGRFEKSADGLALAVALLWGLHPLQTQAVTYIVQRMESLAGMLCLAALYGLLRSADDRTGTSVRAILWRVGSVVAFAFAVGTKENAAVMLLVLLLYERVFLQPTWRAMITSVWYYGALAVPLAWLALYLRPEKVDYEHLSAGVTSWEYLRSQPQVLLHYLRLTFWPHPLVLDYRWPVAESWSQIVPAGLVIVGLLTMSLFAFRQRPWLGFLGLACFILLAPTSSFLPIIDLAFEHRMYLALAPIIVLVVLAAHIAFERLGLEPRSRKLAATGLVLLVASGLGVRTYARNLQWADPLAFWADNVRWAPTSDRALSNLAIELHNRGQTAEAMLLLDRSLQIRPTNHATQYHYGRYLAMEGDFHGAIKHYERALAARPKLDHAVLGLAMAWENLNDHAVAIAHYRRAIEMNPRNAEAHQNLAALHARRGEMDAAEEQLRQGIAVLPKHAELRDRLGNLYARQKKFALAVEEYRAAVQAQPDHLPARIHHAMALLDLGQHAEATRVALQLKRLRPDSQAAAELLKRATAQ